MSRLSRNTVIVFLCRMQFFFCSNWYKVPHNLWADMWARVRCEHKNKNIWHLTRNKTSQIKTSQYLWVKSWKIKIYEFWNLWAGNRALQVWVECKIFIEFFFRISWIFFLESQSRIYELLSQRIGEMSIYDHSMSSNMYQIQVQIQVGTYLLRISTSLDILSNTQVNKFTSPPLVHIYELYNRWLINYTYKSCLIKMLIINRQILVKALRSLDKMHEK